jgi:hypothetical protein
MGDGEAAVTASLVLTLAKHEAVHRSPPMTVAESLVFPVLPAEYNIDYKFEFVK